jgi:HicB family
VPDDMAKFLLRLPKGLHRRLAQQAKRNNVSLNTEILNLLEGRGAADMEKIATMAAEKAINTMTMMGSEPSKFTQPSKPKSE